jgi:hypothetical protein
MDILPLPEGIELQNSPNSLESGGELPVYPQNENKILQSWETRRKIWEQQVNLVQFRQLHCGYISGLIKLDQFTNLGESIFSLTL